MNPEERYPIESRYPRMKKALGWKANLRWFFNGHMLAGAVLGWMLLGSLDAISDVFPYRGPAYVERCYDDGGCKTIPASQYKRERLGDGCMMLVLSLAIWGAVAKDAQEKRRQE